MIEAMIVYSLINFILYGIFYIGLLFFSDDHGLKDIPDDTAQMGWVDGLYTVLNIYAVTLVVIYFILKIRREVRKAFIHNFEENPQERDLNSLMLKTIEVQAPHSMDMDNTAIVRFFDTIYRDLGYSGRVISCVVVPDYHKLFNFEKEREKVTMRYSMFHNNPPVLRCFANNSYYKEDEYHKKIDELNYRIDRKLTRPLRASRTAFVSVDSMDSVKNALKMATPSYINEIINLPDPFNLQQINTNPFDGKPIKIRHM